MHCSFQLGPSGPSQLLYNRLTGATIYAMHSPQKPRLYIASFFATRHFSSLSHRMLLSGSSPDISAAGGWRVIICGCDAGHGIQLVSSVACIWRIEMDKGLPLLRCVLKCMFCLQVGRPWNLCRQQHGFLWCISQIYVAIRRASVCMCGYDCCASVTPKHKYTGECKNHPTL